MYIYVRMCYGFCDICANVRKYSDFFIKILVNVTSTYAVVIIALLEEQLNDS